jgi:hypothetical protein
MVNTLNFKVPISRLCSMFLASAECPTSSNGLDASLPAVSRRTSSPPLAQDINQ